MLLFVLFARRPLIADEPLRALLIPNDPGPDLIFTLTETTAEKCISSTARRIIPPNKFLATLKTRLTCCSSKRVFYGGQSSISSWCGLQRKAPAWSGISVGSHRER